LAVESEKLVIEPLSRLRRNRSLADAIISTIKEVEPPVTIRQLFYALQSRGHIALTHQAYRQLQHLTAWFRYEGVVPYDWFVDRTRRPGELSTWTDPTDYLDMVRQAYRKNLWQGQSDYVEIWLEKDALSSFFANITRQYLVTLMVCRGFSSISFLYETAMDLSRIEKPVYIYFFGDHDPSGRNIESKVVEFLERHGVELDGFQRVAILPEDIEEYKLPPALAKKSDPRYSKFVQEYGTNAVELDALPPKELRKRISDCIVQHIDVDEWRRLRVIEKEEQALLVRIANQLPSDGR